MNRAGRVIWCSSIRQMLVMVAENARSRSKGGFVGGGEAT